MKKFGDDNLRYITFGEGICNLCKYVNGDGITCKAFPKGISGKVLVGEIKHTHSITGDNGIQFSPIEID